MDERIRVWLGDDHSTIHHAPASRLDGMADPGAHGATDCGREGDLTLVHHENVDMGKLCEACMAITGVRPPLAGQSYGPV